MQARIIWAQALRTTNHDERRLGAIHAGQVVLDKPACMRGHTRSRMTSVHAMKLHGLYAWMTKSL